MRLLALGSFRPLLDPSFEAARRGWADQECVARVSHLSLLELSEEPAFRDRSDLEVSARGHLDPPSVSTCGDQVGAVAVEAPLP